MPVRAASPRRAASPARGQAPASTRHPGDLQESDDEEEDIEDDDDGKMEAAEVRGPQPTGTLVKRVSFADSPLSSTATTESGGNATLFEQVLGMSVEEDGEATTPDVPSLGITDASVMRALLCQSVKMPTFVWDDVNASFDQWCKTTDELFTADLYSPVSYSDS